ncbi:hypothetical protein ES705_39460 [subsurface metagenome]
MFKGIIQLYQVGKELGLTRKEINGLFFFRKEAHSLRYKIIFYVILIIAMSLIGLTLVLLRINITKDTYPSGAEYSTVRIKDFKKKFRCEYS